MNHKISRVRETSFFQFRIGCDNHPICQVLSNFAAPILVFPEKLNCTGEIILNKSICSIKIKGAMELDKT